MAKNPALVILVTILSCILFNSATAISPISVKGTKLYDSDGNQFFIKGVAYTSGNRRLDPLLDNGQCQIDAGLMKTLGVNTIRVYTVDGTKNHDACMQTFAAQGIYLWLDLPTPLHAMSRIDPEWNMDLYTNWTGTVDAFAGYDNLLAFTIGNEVINDDKTTITAPYIKAAARDIKRFRDARGYRQIPVSYTATDLLETRVPTADYLACGDSDDAIDMYGMNIYSWCGNASYYTSGFDKLYEQFQDLNIPVVFSETGCKTTGDREFTEVATMLGPVFQAVFSGAIVYEWLMEENGYGLVEYSNSQNTGFPQTLDDYNALSTVFSTVNPPGTAMTAYTPSNSAPACPTSDSSDGWLVDPTAALPTIAGLQEETITARTTITTSTATRSTTASEASETLASPSGGGQQQNAESDGTPTGTIVGIAIGCAAAVVIVAVGAFFFFRRRRSRRQVQEKGGLAEPRGNSPQEGFKSELPAQSVKPVLPRQEMDASQVHEQPQYGVVEGHHELQGGIYHENIPSLGLYEMEGNIPATMEAQQSSSQR